MPPKFLGFWSQRRWCAPALGAHAAAWLAAILLFALAGATPLMAQVITVNPTSLPNGTVGLSYSETIVANDGDPDDTTGPYDGDDVYTYAVTVGALPPGLSLNFFNGQLTGTPSTVGTYSFTITATNQDTTPASNTQSYTVYIGTNSLILTPATLPAGTQNIPYNQTVTASGGNGSYTYSVSSGSLPAGLTLDPSSGAITGTPTTTGQSLFTIQAIDTIGNSGSQSYAVNIGTGGALTVSPTSLPNGTQGTPYTQTVSASGGSSPYTFAVTAGALPAGLTLNPNTGAITGTPSGSGPASFTIQATDSVGNTGSQAYNINIGTVSLTVTPASLPSGTQNMPYGQTLGATGGTGGPYTFAISGGALPAGLALSSAGVISGTPTGSGPSSFTVRALDAQGNAGTRLYTVNIGTASLTVNPATLPAAVKGHPYSQTVTATGGTAPYTFSISDGALPPGLTLNPATGLISGAPTGIGDVTFTVMALDSIGDIGSRRYTLDPRPDPALDPEVQGLIMAQVAAAQRFATAQIDNVSHHLESLHDHFDACSVNFALPPPTQPGAPQPLYATPYGGQSYAGPNQLYSPYGNYGVQGAPLAVGPDGSAAPSQQVARRMPSARDCADWAQDLAVWSAGSFQFGKMTPTGLTSVNSFNSAGVTAGLDLRASDDLIVGAAIGYGADRSDIGQNGTRSGASSYSATLYASLSPFKPFFLDASAGYGTLGYDNRRYVTGEGSMVSGTRRGSYWFGALTASLELARDGVKFAPYLSANYMRASLDGYAESGASAQLLTFNQMTVDALSGAVGVRTAFDIPMRFGVLTPTARLEYRRTSQGAYDQAMYYSDLGSSTASTFSQPSGTQGTTTGALGLRAKARGGLTSEVEYGVSGGASSYFAQTLRAALRVAF